MNPRQLAGLSLLTIACATCSRSPTGPNDNSWRLLPGIVQAVSFPSFRDGRQCWVYLPPGYARSSSRYPVLYLSDGEWVFDGPGGMHVNRICEDLIRRGEIEPIIVVAISRVSDAQRSYDLSPWPDDRFELPTGGGDFFVRAIRDTLKREIDRAYRTLPDHRNTAIAGMSRGGMLAVYAGYAYDSTFGKVAGFSPNYSVGNPGMYFFAYTRGKPMLLERFYQDTGHPDDISIEPMAGLALQQGFVLGRDFLSITVEGAEHSIDAWEHRFPLALKFLFGR